MRAPDRRMHQFRQRRSTAPGFRIVHRQDRIVRASAAHASITSLRPAAAFPRCTLHRVEVKLLGIGGRRRRSTRLPPPRPIRIRPAQLHQQRPDRQRLLVDLARAAMLPMRPRS